MSVFMTVGGQGEPTDKEDLVASPIHKLGAITAGGTLDLSVTKTGGPVITRTVVGSTGSDDRVFSDSELTPGPATMPLDANNSYSVVWTGAFVGAGSATLRVRADSQHGSQFQLDVPVEGNPGDTFLRVVIIP